MTSARRPAGAPGDWEERRPAGAPDEGSRPREAAPDEQAEEGEREQRPSLGESLPETGKDSPGADETESAAAVDADLDALLADVRRERDEYLELAQRARADFENYRKRA